MRRYGSIMIAALIVGTAVAALGQQNKPSDKDRQLFEQLAKDYEVAYNHKDAAAVAALYTDDAIEIRPQGVREGRAALEKEYRGQFENANCHALAITISHYRSSGEIGWADGGWTANCGNNPVHGLWSDVTVREEGKLKIPQNSVVFPEPEPASAKR